MGNSNKATHSAGCNYVGNDGIRRSIAVTQFDDQTIMLALRTYWDGEDSDPLQSTIRMGGEAYSVLLQAMNELAADRNRFAIEADK